MNPTDLLGRAGATAELPRSSSAGHLPPKAVVVLACYGARGLRLPPRIDRRLLSGRCLVREEGRMLLKAPEPGPRTSVSL